MKGFINIPINQSSIHAIMGVKHLVPKESIFEKRKIQNSKSNMKNEKWMISYYFCSCSMLFRNHYDYYFLVDLNLSLDKSIKSFFYSILSAIKCLKTRLHYQYSSTSHMK